MNISFYQKDNGFSLRKSVFFFCFLLLLAHISYSYIHRYSSAVEKKGGTYVEAVFTPQSILPYTSNNEDDSFISHLLFRSCIKPGTGTGANFENDACSVTTKNQKTFTLHIEPNILRSDGKELSLEDVYFTYNTLLKENFWSLSTLESFKSITVQAYRDSITVEFPYASADNYLFFTNPILPAHKVSNISYSDYVSNFTNEFVNSSCAKLSPNYHSIKDIVIDLSQCANVSAKYYQSKQFDSLSQLHEYLNKNPNSIDIIYKQNLDAISGSFEQSGYHTQSILSNTFLATFFNSQKSLISNGTKALLLDMLQDSLSGNNDIQTTSYILDPLEKPELNLQQSLIKDQVAPSHIPTSLPSILLFSGEYQQSFVQSDPIHDTLQLTFAFPKSYDKVSIVHNNDTEITLSTLNQQNNTATFNLSSILRSIVSGNNSYTIHSYSGDTLEQEYKFSIFYGKFQIQTPELQSGDNSSGTITSGEIVPTPLPDHIDADHIMKIKIVYLENNILSGLISSIQSKIAATGLSDFFSWEAIRDYNRYIARLQSKDYDMVFSTIQLGLRKDISNIFISQEATINPSLYTNTTLSNAINGFFLTQGDSKQKHYDTIQEIFRTDVPLWIFGKIKKQIITKAPKESIPERLASFARRQQLINPHSQTTVSAIDRQKVFNRKSLQIFLLETFSLN